MEIKVRPKFAIVVRNTLEGLGLSSIIDKMVPGVEVYIFNRLEDLQESQDAPYIHYFISSQILLEKADFFLSSNRIHRTIILTHGENLAYLPRQVYQLNVSLPEGELVKEVLKMAAKGHQHITDPQKMCPEDKAKSSMELTAREKEVLSLVVKGYINKEIADCLHVSLTTVISHRKNLVDKLNIRSVSGLTIYAVTHGLVNIEDI